MRVRHFRLAVSQLGWCAGDKPTDRFEIVARHRRTRIVRVRTTEIRLRVHHECVAEGVERVVIFINRLLVLIVHILLVGIRVRFKFQNKILAARVDFQFARTHQFTYAVDTILDGIFSFHHVAHIHFALLHFENRGW